MARGERYPSPPMGSSVTDPEYRAFLESVTEFTLTHSTKAMTRLLALRAGWCGPIGSTANVNPQLRHQQPIGGEHDEHSAQQVEHKAVTHHL